MSRRGILEVAVVWAMALSAIAAADASAAPTESNTAFTCAPVTIGTGEFADPDCTTKIGIEKSWSHVEIPEGEETQLTVEGTNVQEIESGLFGLIVNATEVECEGCMVHNHEEAGGAMDLTGTGRLRYTGATTNVGACVVTGGQFTTETLKFTTTTATNLLTEPAAGVTWAVIRFNAGCPIGAALTLTGKANASLKGAFFTFATGLNELKVGKTTALLDGKGTMSAGPTGLTHHPLALTPS